MRNKTFVTLFLLSENVHVLKDVGMIPYFMTTEHGYIGKLATLKIGQYPYIEEYVPQLQLDYIAGDIERAKNDQSYAYKLKDKYIRENAKNIDVLNLYHYNIENLKLACLYKSLNKNGFVYIKLDTAFTKTYEYMLEENSTVKRIKQYIKNLMCKNVDLISTETHYSCSGFSKLFDHKVEYIPNGFYDFPLDNANVVSPKTNTFLTVGRLGTPPKNTELLLEAFAEIYRKCDWNLMLVGSMESSFISYMEKVFSRNEGLRDRVIIKGEVSDKEKLTELYRQAKVFLMPSRWESFSLACAEAEVNGCFLILSDKVAPYREFTDDGKYGIVFPSENKDELVKAMLKSIELDIDYAQQSRYAHDNFNWSRICDSLAKMIERRVAETI